MSSDSRRPTPLPGVASPVQPRVQTRVQPLVQHLTSRDNPLLQAIRRVLRSPAAYRREGRVWLEGDHLCQAWLARGRPVEQAVVGESGWAEAKLNALCAHASAVAVVPDGLMATISSLETPAPMGFWVAWPQSQAIEPLAPTVVLDRLQDAGNVGTILRSAAAFGFTQVVALKGTAALGAPKVLRAAMGAHFGLHLVEGIELPALHALAVPLLATSSHAQHNIAQAVLPWPCAWVLGHEGQGVDAQLQARCAQTLTIPQPGGEESLNVGVAAAICLYESARQRLSLA
jgi:TrmH family RNA methyltransferase